MKLKKSKKKTVKRKTMKKKRKKKPTQKEICYSRMKKLTDMGRMIRDGIVARDLQESFNDEFYAGWPQERLDTVMCNECKYHIKESDKDEHDLEHAEMREPKVERYKLAYIDPRYSYDNIDREINGILNDLEEKGLNRRWQ